MDSQGLRELGAGWKLILACSLGIACGSGTIPMYSIGPFVKPIAAELGWARSSVQAATLFSFGFGALCSPMVGWAVNRFGLRVTALSGLFGVALGFLIVSVLTTAPWHFYLGYSVIAIAGAGSNPVTWTRALAGNFSRSRGLALGLALSGTGLCAILAPTLTTLFIDGFGWRAAYVALALATLVIGGLPALFLLPLRAGNEPAGKAGGVAGPDDWPLSPGKLITLLISISALYLPICGIIANVIPATTDRGLSNEAAASLLGFYGVAMVIGRVATGSLLDRFWAPAVAALTLLPSAAAAIVLGFSDNYVFLAIAAAVIGWGAGAELDVLPYLIVRYFGLRRYSNIYGWLYGAVSLVAAVAPFIFALGYDLDGSYAVPFIVASGLYLLGSISFLALGAYPRTVEKCILH